MRSPQIRAGIPVGRERLRGGIPVGRERLRRVIPVGRERLRGGNTGGEGAPKEGEYRWGGSV